MRKHQEDVMMTWNAICGREASYIKETEAASFFFIASGQIFFSHIPFLPDFHTDDAAN